MDSQVRGLAGSWMSASQPGAYTVGIDVLEFVQDRERFPPTVAGRGSITVGVMDVAELGERVRRTAPIPGLPG